MFVAITDDDNSPLSGYRIVGTHDSGLQLESRESAGAWTENSGAMHYKAGNIKYEALNSPVEFSFDTANPTWYFLYFERQKWPGYAPSQLAAALKQPHEVRIVRLQPVRNYGSWISLRCLYYIKRVH